MNGCEDPREDSFSRDDACSVNYSLHSSLVLFRLAFSRPAEFVSVYLTEFSTARAVSVSASESVSTSRSVIALMFCRFNG